jgi:hypothetical protein
MTREEEALKLIEAFQSEIGRRPVAYQRIANLEELVSSRAILETAPDIQAAIVRLEQRLPAMRYSYALSNLSFQLYRLTSPATPALIEQGALRSLPEQQGQELFQAYTSEVEQAPDDWDLRPATLPAGQAILEADVLLQIVVGHLIARNTALSHYPRAEFWQHFRVLLDLLYKRRLPYTLEDIQGIVRTWGSLEYPPNAAYQALLRALSYPLANPATLAVCRADLERLQTTALTWHSGADVRKFLRLLEHILHGQEKSSISIRADEWGKQVDPLFSAMEPDLRKHWHILLDHCAQANGSAPGKMWITQMPPLVAAVGKDTLCRTAITWIDAFGKQRGDRLAAENAHLLRGLIWCCTEIEDATLASSLANAAIEGFRKITGVGPRSAKIASACLSVLKGMPSLHGAAQLERVRMNVKQPTYLKEVEKALDEAARRANMSRADLEELTVPTFGLEQGCLRVALGSVGAEVHLMGLAAQILWYDTAGQPRNTEPAEVKRAYKTERKDLKRLCEDITHMLTAQRDRLERLPLAERTWSLAAWRERYLDYPLVGQVAKRLIWRFSTNNHSVDAIWQNYQFIDANDRLLDLAENTIVSPWHPLLCEANEVLSWRNCLERHQITQPFKQAHREVYLLTDAERTTHVYSNRFAAHILRQHQFNALAAVRGWKNTLRLAVDDVYPPATLALPHWSLRAEFWIEGAGGDYPDTNEAGTYLQLTTDQVRFYAIEAPENGAQAGTGVYRPGYHWQLRHRHDEPAPLALEEIPALVFSEVMRDVDLFVGVASVGNDPTWVDGGPNQRYRAYWHDYGFGDLSATARTRKQVLDRLIPRLSISDRCSLEGRFLKVHGNLHTYKIHLGSGNILMEPNDQYLCIVPGHKSSPSPTEGLHLPFEGDTVLSIILSKAFLLAEDTNITDPSILHQIGNTAPRRNTRNHRITS